MRVVPCSGEALNFFCTEEKYECKKPQSSRAVTLGVSVDGDPAAELSHES